MVYGNRLYGTASIFYDANNDQRASHYSRSLQLNQPSFSGWSQVSDAEPERVCLRVDDGRARRVAGDAWRTGAHGPVLHSDCVAYVERPRSVRLQSRAGRSAVPCSASPLLYYTLDHATARVRGKGRILRMARRRRFAAWLSSPVPAPRCISGTMVWVRTVMATAPSNQSLAGSMARTVRVWCYDPAIATKVSTPTPTAIRLGL